MTLGERVYQLRNEKSWSQAELARRACLGASTISEVETGRRRHFRVYTLMGLAQALDVPPHELLRLNDCSLARIPISSRLQLRLYPRPNVEGLPGIIMRPLGEIRADCAAEDNVLAALVFRDGEQGVAIMDLAEFKRWARALNNRMLRAMEGRRAFKRAERALHDATRAFKLLAERIEEGSASKMEEQR